MDEGRSGGGASAAIGSMRRSGEVELCGLVASRGVSTVPVPAPAGGVWPTREGDGEANGGECFLGLGELELPVAAPGLVVPASCRKRCE